MTTTYEDDAVSLDERGITIKNYLYPGNRRLVPYETITSTEVIELGALSGRHRLVGIGFRRPTYFFHWDRSRSDKTHAIALDTGRTMRTVISPEANGLVLELVEQQINGPGTAEARPAPDGRSVE